MAGAVPDPLVPAAFAPHRLGGPTDDYLSRSSPRRTKPQLSPDHTSGLRESTSPLSPNPDNFISARSAPLTPLPGSDVTLQQSNALSASTRRNVVTLPPSFDPEEEEDEEEASESESDSDDDRRGYTAEQADAGDVDEDMLMFQREIDAFDAGMQEEDG